MPPGYTVQSAKHRKGVTVIDEQLIRDCIYIDPLPGSEDDRRRTRGVFDRLSGDREDREKIIARQIELHNVTCLMFSYRSLLKIDNLVGLGRLTKLHLDNNKITRIENLSHLTSLTWLDLSFNEISSMEGIEALTKLQDLSLYSNTITQICGLDALHELTCFSLGKNQIENLDEAVRYLHRLHKNLRMLTLSGNKVETQAHYRARVLAYLPELKYLDNRMVGQAEIAKAREEQHENLVPIEEEDIKMEQEAKTLAEQQQQEADYKRYNCPNENRLFELLYRLDIEGKVQIIPLLEVDTVSDYIKEVVERFQTEFTAKAKELSDVMRALRQKRDDEDKDFESTLHFYKEKNSTNCKKIIKEFQKALKNILPSTLKAKPDSDSYDEEKGAKAQELLVKLKFDLLEAEADQFDALGGVIAMAVNAYKGDNVELILQTAFEGLGKNEAEFQGQLKSLLDSLYEERQKSLDEASYHNPSDSSKQLLYILDNKEEYQKLLGEWQEVRRKKLEELEQQHLKSEEVLIEERSAKILTDEQHRHRTRVMEIHSYIKGLSQTLNQMEIEPES